MNKLSLTALLRFAGLKLVAMALFLLPTTGQSELIVNLDPAAAEYNSVIDGNSTGVTDPNHPNGMTFNITLTPNAADIAQTSNAISLIEIGGNANGSGLYLLGGELHFISKLQGVATNVIPTFNDLDYTADGNNMIGVKSSFGALTADTEYSVAVIYDPITAGSLRLSVKPDGGVISNEDYTLTGIGTKFNWSGNDTFTTFISPSNAGGGNTVGGHPFNEANMPAFAGVRGQGLYWNAIGSTIPEPSSMGLLVIGLVGIASLRRVMR